MHLRTLSTALAASALVAGAGAVGAPTAAAAPPASGHLAPAWARVLDVFPDDRLTVPDRRQLTGRRVDLPQPDCAAQPTACDVVRLLEQLDGFDLDPRMSLTFSRQVDPARVAAGTTVERVSGPGPALRTGVDRVVYDAERATVHLHPAAQLAPATTYRLRVRVLGVPPVDRTFTTMSATTDLRRMVARIDTGAAHTAAGIAPQDRGLQVDRVVPAAGTSLAYTADRGPASTPVTSFVPNFSGGGVGSYVFGSYLAPSWLTPDRVIPQRPTRSPGPLVRGQQRLPFVLLVPAGTPPAGGWPVAVFGHGFTRSAADVFLAANANASRGLATVATHVVGHGYGPASTWDITRDGVTTRTPAYGRGVDVDGNGVIEATEGVAAAISPRPFGAVNSRDGLRQTVADVATLVRAVARGLDQPDVAALSGTGTTYYGQSFGGIYGTMLGGADPRVSRLVLNVAGGPVTEIARLSPSFRPLTTQALGSAVPSLLNGGYAGFTESLPLVGDPVVRTPAPGALAIQDYLAKATWLTRSGSPEAYAPLLRATPPGGGAPKPVLFQVAYGDQTVPNPTSQVLLAAGGLFDRASLYRNDLTAQKDRNPHGFLLDPTFAQAFPGQRQAIEFLVTGRTTDPDADGGVWEVPVTDPTVLRNLGFPNPLHP